MSAWEGDVDPISKTRRIFLESGFDTLPARFNVDFNDIKEGEEIGNGLWGPVLEAEWLGRKVAIKKFNRTSQNVLLMAKEVKPMLDLRHPNILKLFGFSLLAKEDLILQCSMIMELMDCDLDKYIEKRRGIQEQDEGRGLPLSDDEGLYIIAEIARGMNHMHKCGYFHRDLKPGNILIKKSDVSKSLVDVKIADFGTSGLMGDSNCDRNAGTLRYKAPELFDPTATLKPDKMDVFSFGVLCSKILTGEEPYGDRAGQTLEEHIRNGGKPAIPDRNLPDDVVGVIKECLKTNPEARPDFQKICGTLEPALQKVWRTPRSVATSSAGISSHPEELESDQLQYLMSLVDRFGLPKDYINYVILPHDVKLLRVIGYGSYSTVYLVEWKGTRYALKQNIDDSSIFFPCWKILPRLIHRNIVTFMGYYLSSDEQSNRSGVIMELLETDLHSSIRDLQRHPGRNSPRFSEQKSRYIMKEIAEGMAYLHGKDILHGDLKPENVLISRQQDTNEDMVVKLIDFSGEEVSVGTTLYSAPEILNYRKDRNFVPLDWKKADVYSFGITFSEILGAAIQGPEYLMFSPQMFRNPVMQGMRAELPGDISQDLKDLIQSCCNQDPSSRPDFCEICEFFSKHTAVQHRMPSKQPAVQHRMPSKQPAVEHRMPSKQPAVQHRMPSKQPAVEHRMPSKQPAVQHRMPSKQSLKACNLL